MTEHEANTVDQINAIPITQQNIFIGTGWLNEWNPSDRTVLMSALTAKLVAIREAGTLRNKFSIHGDRVRFPPDLLAAIAGYRDVNISNFNYDYVFDAGLYAIAMSAETIRLALPSNIGYDSKEFSRGVDESTTLRSLSIRFNAFRISNRILYKLARRPKSFDSLELSMGAIGLDELVTIVADRRIGLKSLLLDIVASDAAPIVKLATAIRDSETLTKLRMDVRCANASLEEYTNIMTMIRSNRSINDFWFDWTDALSREQRLEIARVFYRRAPLNFVNITLGIRVGDIAEMRDERAARRRAYENANLVANVGARVPVARENLLGIIHSFLDEMR